MALTLKRKEREQRVIRPMRRYVKGFKALSLMGNTYHKD
jgi:hypothetical protein